ncbi:MAG: hypothetical protein L6R40_005720 [Gallowayella cf. fulva]|nr:MAG: hypothetical protein L6R40_005720 [Xanthomendoza cf. fulva]
MKLLAVASPVISAISIAVATLGTLCQAAPTDTPTVGNLSLTSSGPSTWARHQAYSNQSSKATSVLTAGRFPPIPPDFSTKCTTVQPARRHLPTRFVYPLAIAFLRERQRLDWEAVVSDVAWFRLAAPSNLIIHVRPVERAPASSPLRNSHVMFGIYDAVLYMSTHGSLPTSVKMKIAGGVVGVATITESTTAGSEAERKNGRVSSSDDIWSGTIVDPNDSRRAVVYHHQGREVREDDLLTLVMQALITLTYDGKYEYFNNLQIVSRSGRCYLYMEGTGGGRAADPSIVAEMLVLLVGAFYPSTLFDEMTFSMEFGDEGRRRMFVQGWFSLFFDVGST